MSRASRTLNPLHFEDLEPHRFEDLVRQLAYDYRPWASIEATGRGGADDGIDIRAFEKGTLPEPLSDEDDDLLMIPRAGRLWIIQCKREKRITPKQVKRYVQESIQGDPTPYGFILAAACDFSKKSYDAFRSSLIGSGVQEFHLWGKAELEDMLFQPKNDHLLFAYFGISLQTRKRSRQSELRAKTAWRKRVGKVIGGLTTQVNTDVLIRDATDECYPVIEEVENFDAHPRWGIYRVHFLSTRNTLMIETGRYLAFHDQSTGEWDAMREPVPPYHQHSLYGRDYHDDGHWKRQQAWSDCVPAEHQAELVVMHGIRLDRILAVDEEGDLVHPLPILYVDPLPSGRLFDADEAVQFLTLAGFGMHKSEFEAAPEKRIAHFKD